MMQRDNGSSASSTLGSWGGVSCTVGAEFRPSAHEQVGLLVQRERDRPLIARGFARSYGDCCYASAGGVITMTECTEIDAFDEARGIIVCGGGMSLRRLAALVEPRGWSLPVYPGTGFVSVGGAIANDVHGKEQHVNGTFGQAVLWMDLVLANGDTVRVDPSSGALFEATVGGIGLTGIVVRAALQLVRRTSNAMRVESHRAGSIDAILDLLQSSRDRYPSMVAWVDLMSSRSGRGVVELAAPAPENVAEVPSPTIRDLPFVFPEFAINRLSMTVFNALYFHRVPRGGSVRDVHRNRFIFPLDAIGEWNRAYGARGLYQFQCCLPEQTAHDTFARMRDYLVRVRQGSTLAVIKYVGKTGAGMLSFLRPGYSFAMDFPRSTETRRVILALQEMTVEAGGRVYLAKDACLRPDEFRLMYPRLVEFRHELERVDPTGVWQSDMSRRLKIRDP